MRSRDARVEFRGAALSCDLARGDTVVRLGAGSIAQWAYALPEELKALG